ncbi:hypothetical protein GEV43_25340 [Actinomadura sp. J1-007]|nr:hypothetical protein [Actinomadura sp. J1-007]
MWPFEMIAEEGLHGLTHRAVDAPAELPPGSTGSCHRTRLTLLEAVLAQPGAKGGPTAVIFGGS